MKNLMTNKYVVKNLTFKKLSYLFYIRRKI